MESPSSPICAASSQRHYTPAPRSHHLLPRHPQATTKTVRKIKCIVLGGAGAGKTSILRRYFHGKFDPNRMPTLGSDFYSRNIPDPTANDKTISITTEGDNANEDEKKDASPSPPLHTMQHPKASLSMQVWDTPGRERFAANRKPMYTAAFSDNFFKNADAAILVYDMTSSTSFTHVLKWHADLVERIRRLEATGERTRPFPCLIVANKLDKMRNRDTHPSRQQAVVPQRDVMGLAGISFRGKDSRYEYSASPTPASNKPPSSNSLKSSSSKKASRPRTEISTYMGTGDQTSYLQAVLNNDVQGSYLESLLSTEDGSHPDKDMVLLWCMRNGLMHMEVSALDGTGIDDLIDEMVQMALQASQPPPLLQDPKSSSQLNNEKPILQQRQNSKLTTAIETVYEEVKRNEELDLHRRYAPKGSSCFGLPLLRRCKF